MPSGPVVFGAEYIPSSPTNAVSVKEDNIGVIHFLDQFLYAIVAGAYLVDIGKVGCCGDRCDSRCDDHAVGHLLLCFLYELLIVRGIGLRVDKVNIVHTH